MEDQATSISTNPPGPRAVLDYSGASACVQRLLGRGTTRTRFGQRMNDTKLALWKARIVAMQAGLALTTVEDLPMELTHSAARTCPMELTHSTTAFQGAKLELILLFVGQISNRSIGRIVNANEEDPMEEAIERAFYILNEHPRLAAEKYRGRFPLGHFLSAVASPEVVVQTIELYPDALREPVGNWKGLPLHLACNKEYPSGVIKTMVDHFPEASWKKNARNKVPIQCALRRASTAANDAIKTLLAKDSLLVKIECPPIPGGNEPTDLLQHAISLECGRETLEVIAEHYAKHRTSLTIHDFGTFDEDTVLGLAKVIPQLRKVEFRPSNWVVNGFVLLMQQLVESPNLKELRLRLPDFEAWPGANTLTKEAIRGLLLQTKTIRSLHISFPLTTHNRPSPGHVDWLATIGSCLQDNHCVKTLFVDFLKITERTLTDFLAEGSAPASFSILSSDVQGGEDAPLALPEVWDKCRVEHLQIAGCVWEGKCISETNLPLLVGKMPCVHILSPFHLFSDWKLTTQILSMLTNPQIRSLRLFCSNVDVKAICEQLKVNTTATSCYFMGLVDAGRENIDCFLDVLEHYNTTLLSGGDRLMADCLRVGSAEEQRELNDKIRYWTNLNRCGRGFLWQHQMTLESFISHLTAVGKEIVIKSATDELSVLFGLLREGPGLWHNTIITAHGRDGHAQRPAPKSLIFSPLRTHR